MHSELSSPSAVSSIFSPFLDLGSPTSDSKLFLSSRTASPNILENSWIQISREETFSPPFDRTSLTDSVTLPLPAASFYESGDDIETRVSDCAEDDESDCSKDAAVEEALRASLATLLATRNLSQIETAARTTASSPKPIVLNNGNGNGELHYTSASSFNQSSVQGKNAPSPPRADLPFKPKSTANTPVSGSGELHYNSASPASSFNLSVQGMNAPRAPHHSRLSAQQNASAFLDKSCLLCALHLCQKKASNQHRTLSSPPSPKLQCSPAPRSASCPTTPPPTPLLIPRKKKGSLRGAVKLGEIVHASKRPSKGREIFCHAAGVDDPNVEDKEVTIGPSDANDKNSGDTNGESPEGIVAWIARMWLNAGLKIKVLSAIAFSAMLLGTGLSARSYLHQVRMKTAISTTSVIRI